MNWKILNKAGAPGFITTASGKNLCMLIPTHDAQELHRIANLIVNTPQLLAELEKQTYLLTELVKHLPYHQLRPVTEQLVAARTVINAAHARPTPSNPDKTPDKENPQTQ